MTVVYHLQPRTLRGNVLYPLNQLKHIYPDLYAKHREKYQGREPVTERRIPLLNCQWNDVVFFSNVHPETIRDGFLQTGHLWKPQTWYQVDTIVAGFTARNTVIYQPNAEQAKGDYSLAPEQFTPFEPNQIAPQHQLPAHTLDYYAQCYQEKRPVLAWHGLPHILHQGAVDLAQVASAFTV
jgi:hypothetical protein